jgi:hypothetical protein
MKVLTNIFFFLVLTISINAQVNEFPKLKEADFPGLKISREQIFDGSSLWGYINGGADIFLEYGFDKLLLQEIESGGLKIKIELYRMISPSSAFGIYSVSHYKCENKIKSVYYSCITQYQIQCIVDCYYISIINTNGSIEEQELANKLIGKIITSISGTNFIPPQIFNSKLLLAYHDQLKYFKGMLGLQIGMMEWYDYFDGLEGFDVFVLPFSEDDNSVYVAHIKFNSGASVNTFLSRVGIEFNPSAKYSKSEGENISRIVKMLNNNEMIFVEGKISISKLEAFAKQIW